VNIEAEKITPKGSEKLDAFMLFVMTDFGNIKSAFCASSSCQALTVQIPITDPRSPTCVEFLVARIRANLEKSAS
jgi:hypothetical protein